MAITKIRFSHGYRGSGRETRSCQGNVPVAATQARRQKRQNVMRITEMMVVLRNDPTNAIQGSRMNSASWGNAREIGALLERTREPQALRLASGLDASSDITRLEMADIRSATGDL